MTAEQALISAYQRAARRLRAQVLAELERGATGTAAYHAGQLEQAQAVLKQLGKRSRALHLQAAIAPYRAGATAVDASLGMSSSFGFTGSHQRAVRSLAHNLTTRLDDAVDVVGRRVDDALRRVALEETATNIAAGGTRRELSAALQDRLVRDRLTDALTGFVDRRGARWSLDNYAEMVARTTTREAMAAGTANRMTELGGVANLITISSHGTTCLICREYEGKTFALPGFEVDGYETIDQLWPFHPNCLHYGTPAAGSAERYVQQLEAAMAA